MVLVITWIPCTMETRPMRFGESWQQSVWGSTKHWERCWIESTFKILSSCHPHLIRKQWRCIQQMSTERFKAQWVNCMACTHPAMVPNCKQFSLSTTCHHLPTKATSTNKPSPFHKATNMSWWNSINRWCFNPAQSLANLFKRTFKLVNNNMTKWTWPTIRLLRKQFKFLDFQSMPHSPLYPHCLTRSLWISSWAEDYPVDILKGIWLTCSICIIGSIMSNFLELPPELSTRENLLKFSMSLITE